MAHICSQYYRGVWTDYSASWLNRKCFSSTPRPPSTRSLPKVPVLIIEGRQLVVDESTALFLAAFLAVVITLTSTRLWILVSELFEFILKQIEDALRARTERASGSEGVLFLEDSELDHGLPRCSNAGIPFTVPPVLAELNILRKHSRSDIAFGLRSFKSAIRVLRHPSGKSLEICIKLGASLFGFLSFTAMTVGSILSANVVVGSTALCNSPDCGWYYMPAGSSVRRGEVPAALIQRFIENEAAAAAHEAKCYNDMAPADCGSFVANTLPYNEFHNTKCPFRADICSGGQESAFTLDTGLLDSSLLGINSPKKYLFRRRTICAPLVMNTTYIKISDQPQGKGTVSYQYGGSTVSNESYSSVDPLLISDIGYSGYFL